MVKKGEKDKSVGKLSIAEIQKMLNKQNAGGDAAFLLKDNDPTTVKEWIPTGADWLDCIICKGTRAGIPVGRISELAGENASGKSYFAAQIAANAQKMGIKVIYFDSEAAVDKEFWEASGVNLDEILYVQASSVEQVLESIESLLSTDDKYLFILDSLAMTPTRKEEESVAEFNPLSSMAEKARILSKGIPKLITPLQNQQSTFLVLNQLKTNIAKTPAEQLTTPWTTPGGKTLNYAYSLRIWLTKRKAKDSFILDEHSFKIGTEVKAKLEKSRFGTEGRECVFKIIWGDKDNLGVQNAESIFQAIRTSPRLSGGAAGRWTLTPLKGGEIKFQTGEWSGLYKNDKKFKELINLILEEEVIQKFQTKSANAKNFYDVDQALTDVDQALTDVDQALTDLEE